MDQKELQQDNKTNTTSKTHEDIIGIIHELKSFEDKYKEYTIIEPEYEKEILEIDIDKSDLSEPEIIEKEPKNDLIQILKLKKGKEDIEKKGLINNAINKGLYSKLRDIFFTKIKKKLPFFQQDISVEGNEIGKKQPISSTNVFKMRFDDNGKLNVIDMRKPKPKPNINVDMKKYVKFIKKKENEEKSESPSKDEDKSKISAIKDKIVGKIDIKSISKIKDIIPFISKKEKEK